MRHVSAILLTLPDGKIVLQRRSKDSLRFPGMLGLFGGNAENGESFDETMERELSEETSLNINSLVWGFVQDFELTFEDNSGAIFHIYWAEIPNADFEVFEGVGSEVYSRQEAINRDDLIPSCRYVLTNILKEK